MRSATTRRFRKDLDALPEEVHRLAKRAFRTWKADPHYPGLEYKRVQTEAPVWSARVGDHYRVLALVEKDRAEWFWIGSHADYDRILPRL